MSICNRFYTIWRALRQWDEQTSIAGAGPHRTQRAIYNQAIKL
jgi:hypothetical protein